MHTALFEARAHASAPHPDAPAGSPWSCDGPHRDVAHDDGCQEFDHIAANRPSKRIKLTPRILA